MNNRRYKVFSVDKIGTAGGKMIKLPKSVVAKVEEEIFNGTDVNSKWLTYASVVEQILIELGGEYMEDEV